MKSLQAPSALRSLFLLLCISEIVGCGSIGGDARSAGREAGCRANLRTLYDGLKKHISLYGDVPRDKDGKASLIPLTEPEAQNAIGIDSSILKCPAERDSTGPSYLLNPALSTHDFGPDSATVIACDRVPNHRGGPGRNGATVVLIGNGTTVVITLPEDDQEAWRRLFLAGDERACRISKKDGSTEPWTDDDITWFVGQERGYVSNR